MTHCLSTSVNLSIFNFLTTIKVQHTKENKSISKWLKLWSLIAPRLSGSGGDIKVYIRYWRVKRSCVQCIIYCEQANFHFHLALSIHKICTYNNKYVLVSLSHYQEYNYRQCGFFINPEQSKNIPCALHFISNLNLRLKRKLFLWQMEFMSRSKS